MNVSWSFVYRVSYEAPSYFLFRTGFNSERDKETIFGWYKGRFGNGPPVVRVPDSHIQVTYLQVKIINGVCI